MDKILLLPVKKKWFNMVEAREKREEYRALSSYWISRLIDFYCGSKLDNEQYRCLLRDYKDNLERCNSKILWRHYSHLMYHWYSTPRPKEKFEIKSIRIGIGKEKWGAVAEEPCFIFDLG